METSGIWKLMGGLNLEIFSQCSKAFSRHLSLNKLFFCFQGFSEILGGKYDHLPEVAFYMVGPIEEVEAKAETLAKST